MQRAPSPVQERMIEGLAKLPPARRRELIAGLEAVVEAIGVAGETAGMFFEDDGGEG